MAGQSKIYELALATFLQAQTYSEVFSVERRNILGTAKELAVDTLRCFVSNMDRSIVIASRADQQRDYRVGIYLLQALKGALGTKETRVDELVDLVEQIEESITAAAHDSGIPGVDVPFGINHDIPTTFYDKDLLAAESVFVAEIPVTFTNLR